MTFGVLTIQPLVALVAGVLILIAPRLLNYVVAIYLIIVGVLGLWPGLFAGTGAS
jgi:general stress protein CsbA